MHTPSLKLIASTVALFTVLMFVLPAHAWPRRDFDRDYRAPDDVLGHLNKGAFEPLGRDPSLVIRVATGFDLVGESTSFDIPSSVNGFGGIRQAAPGFAHPVRWMRLMRGFDGNNCWHQGLDIASHGPIAGIGQPIYAIVRSKVTFIGTPEMNAAKYGKRDRRRGFVKRGAYNIPRRVQVDGYPMLYPFTRDLGSAKTGVFIITEAMHPRIEGYDVRYMHLAAVRPDLRVGDTLEAGEEIGVMGSTAIMESMPHLHLDIETPGGRRLDPAHFLGVGHIVGGRCRSIYKRAIAAKRSKRRAARRHRKH